MDIAQDIRICMIKRNMKTKDLAEKSGQSRQNITNKLRNNDFKTSELEKIANALNSDLRIQFIDRDTKEPII